MSHPGSDFGVRNRHDSQRVCLSSKSGAEETDKTKHSSANEYDAPLFDAGDLGFLTDVNVCNGRGQEAVEAGIARLSM